MTINHSQATSTGRILRMERISTPKMGESLYARSQTDLLHILNVVVPTDTYTTTAYDDVIVCNKATAMTVNLLAASGSGRRYIIKNINTGIVTINGDGGDTIDGQITQPLYQWESMQIIDYAANAWVIV